MRKLILSFLLISLCGALRAAPASPFHAMLDNYYEEYLALFPIDAAVSGDNDPRYEAVWPDDISAAYRAKIAAMCGKYLGELAKFDRAALSATDRLSYDTLQWSLSARRELGTLGEKQLGAKFDLPGFHDAVLMGGALPLAVLDAHLRSWLAVAAGK